jgi:hypothetical protein
MRTWHVLMAAVVLAGCADVTAWEGEPAYKKGGASSPGSDVGATFAIHIDGGKVYRESGAGNNGKGECLTGGRWHNPETKRTSVGAHPQCLSVVPSQTLAIALVATANYVQSPSGNDHLNFGDGSWIKYSKQTRSTSGQGGIGGSDDFERYWSIDFTQALLNDTGNLLVRTGTPVEACSTELGCHIGILTW